MEPIKVLVIEESSLIRDYLAELVEIIGYHTRTLTRKREFLAEFHRHNPDLLLLGSTNHAGQIRALADVIEREKSGTPILVILDGEGLPDGGKIPGRANLSYLPSGFDTDELKCTIEQLVHESQDPCYKELDRTIVGQTPAMVQIKRYVLRLARSDVTVLISGESGTGKELVARAIHRFSHRADKPFIKVNSAALPTNLLESELFGFEKGAFTGAFKKKLGKFELADLGTILLDEICEIPLPMQAKLLQVLQDSELSSLGSTTNTKIDSRVLAATNCDLGERVSQGRFRSDLYYRLNVASIHIPPLKERKEDIDLLCKHFLRQYSARYGREYSPFSDRIRERLHEYSWPGNVRELENCIQSFTALGNKEALHEKLAHYGPTALLNNADEPLSSGEGGTNAFGTFPTPSLKKVCKEAARKAETEAIMDVLFHTYWNRKKAAVLLKTSYKSLLNKIKEYGIEKQYHESARRDDRSDDYNTGLSM